MGKWLIAEICHGVYSLDGRKENVEQKIIKALLRETHSNLFMPTGTWKTESSLR